MHQRKRNEARRRRQVELQKMKRAAREVRELFVLNEKEEEAKLILIT